ncbi:MAG TPA: Ig-like domain-containing protein [Candidatus Angelobacter sp.]
MRRFAIIPGIIFLLGTILTGCGGGSKPVNNAVTTVTVTPTSLSLNDGDVVQLTATAQNSAGTAVTATFTFNSSNPNLVTVSSSGLVCGGVWDTNFIVCNGKNGAGTPVSGTTTLTVTASGVTSSPVTVAVHPKVSSVVVDPVAGCTSRTLTQQFTGHACSAQVLPHDSSGPCAPNASEVTSQIGAFSWGTVDPTVATIDTNGLLTAVNPGFTGVFATVSGVNSAADPFRTCMPIEIRLHVTGDPPGTLTTSATMTQNQTLTLESDMTDEKGFVTNSVATISTSNFPIVASFSGTTLTAASFGGAGLFSGCTPPTCGNGFPQPFPVYSNLFSVTVPGTSPAPIVWATSSFTPPTGTFATLVPIDTSKNPPTAGTAINLPGTPNSLVFAANGTNAYLGTTGGLVSLNPTSNTVTTLDPNITGKVLAVSANGTKIIVSNAAKDPQGNVIQPVGPSQRLWVVDTSSSTSQTFVKAGAVAASINNDGFRDYITTNDGTGNIYVFSPAGSLQTINIPGNSSSVAGLSSGPYAYIANSAGLEVVATCNNVQQPTANNPPTHSSTIQLVQPVANADQIVAVDSSGIDVETVTVNSILSTNPPLPFVLSPANCAPPVSYSNQFLDFGIGPFTASQLLVGTNGARVAVLPVGIPNVLSAAPGATPAVATIPLAGGGTQALSGGMTPDGNTVWVGVAGTNTVDKINLNSGTDDVQVTTSFKKFDGSAAPPDIVAVQPK